MAALALEALVRASLQGGAYALVVWAICALLPRLPGGLRALLWWLVSLKFLVALIGPAPVPLPLLPAAQESVQIVPVLGTPAKADTRASRHSSGNALLVAAWVALVAGGVGFFVRDLRRARRLRLGAVPAPSLANETFERLRHRLGVRQSVRLATSPEVASPQVLGPWRPLVLIPELQENDLEMVLAHELLHVKRGDLWLSLVPQLARLLLPFHPLTHLAAREERLAREAACDAAVLRALHRAPREYGALLLRFGVVPSRPGAAAGAPTFRSLRRRLQMLDHAERPRLRAVHVVLVLLGLVTLIPFAVVTRTDAAANPVVASAPVEADAVESDEAFIVRHGQTTTMLADTDVDGAAYKRLQRSGGDFFYFRDGSRQWVTRDPSVLADAERVLAPVREIGQQQGELGGRQGALGAQQGLLGAKQGQLGAELGQLAGERDDQDRLQREMDALGQEMDALGERMDLLGEEMDLLGKRMDAASERARAELRRVAEDAIRRGVAQPLAW